MSPTSDGKSVSTVPAEPSRASNGANAEVVAASSLVSDSKDRKTVILIYCLIALAVWIVFGQTRHYAFINYDDDAYVYANPVITSGLNWNGIVWVFTHSHANNWHPLSSMSHMLDCHLYGWKPGGHHVSNVLLHAATAILLFLVLRNMTGRLWPSAFVAAVFAVHPLRVESVAWISERKDVLSGLFFVLTIGAYLRYARRPFALGRYLLVLFVFLMGLLSKPMLVTLPFVLLLLDYWPLERIVFPIADARSLRRLIFEKIPFFLMAGALGGITMAVQDRAIGSLQDYDFYSRATNAVVAYCVYLKQMFWPKGLALLYPHLEHQLPLWMVYVSGLILVVISVIVVSTWRKWPFLVVGWLWYLGMLVPVIGIVQVGDQAHADRYTYLPQIGLYILVTWAVVELSSAWHNRRAVLSIASGGILIALMSAASIQTTHWRDSVSIWSRTLAFTSRNSTAHHNLGNELMLRGNLNEAVANYQKAVEFFPNYTKARNNLGAAYLTLGKFPEAVEQYEKILQRLPNYPNAHFNLATALAAQRKFSEAIPHYERVLQFKPDSPDVHFNLAVTLMAVGRLDEAIQHFGRLLQLNPDHVDGHYSFGNALAAQGKWNEAGQHFQKVIQLKPDHADALNNLGNALATLGRINEALPYFERVVQLRSDVAEARGNLASAFLAQGKTDEAIRQFQEAGKLATAQGNAALAESFRKRIESAQATGTQPKTN